MKIRNRSLSTRGLWLALILGGSINLPAAPISGVFSVTGSVRVTLDRFDWAPLLGGTGIVNVGLLGNSGYFAGLAGQATIDDLIQPEGQAGNPAAVLLNGFAAPYNNFAVTQALFIVPSAPLCAGPIAVNTSCSLGNSTLTQLAGGLTVTVQMTGLFVDGVNDNTPGSGSFTTQLDNTTVADILTELQRVGYVDSTFSATFSSVPEPSTYALTGAMLLAGALARKRLRR